MSKITVNRRMEVEGKPIFVLDGLFDAAFIDGFYLDILSRDNLSFGRMAQKNKGSRLLSAIHSQFQAETRPCLKKLIETAGEVLEQENIRHRGIAKVQTNASSFGEFQHSHQDLGNLWTALYFANPVWPVDWMGELHFYDDLETEVLVSVTPKPGRLVIFDGNIHHRGGVPSRLSEEVRWGVAVKFLKK